MGVPASITDNEGGIVVTIRDGRHSFLVSGDIGQPTEQRMAKHMAPVSVIQVPHHGSKHSSSPQFVTAADPTWAVIQSGRNNRYGHPHASVLARWKATNVVETRVLGTVQFRTNGVRMSAMNWEAGRGWVNLKDVRQPVSWANP